MTSINTTSLSLYSSALTVRPSTDTTQATDAEPGSVKLQGNLFKSVSATGETGGAPATNPVEEAIKQLKERIKEAQKQLKEQQEQLAAVMNSRMSEQEKAQRVMAIQQQIAGTLGLLAGLQASLMEMVKGSIKTTA